MTPRAED